MAFSLDSLFSKHQNVLGLHAKRAELLANNLANQDTPGFKARDIDFKEALSAALDKPAGSSELSLEHPGFDNSIDPSPYTQYRQSFQPSLDGNTVDSDIEKAAFAQNSLGFSANITFINQKFKDLYTAVRSN